MLRYEVMDIEDIVLMAIASWQRVGLLFLAVYRAMGAVS